MLVALNVMEHDDQLLERAEFLHGALEIEAVEGTGQDVVGDGEFLQMTGTIGFRIPVSLEPRFEGSFSALAHKSEVDRDAVQPGGESGIAAESVDFAEYHEEDILQEIFGFGDVSSHAQADGVDAGIVQLVEAFKCGGVSLLSPGDRFLLG